MHIMLSSDSLHHTGLHNSVGKVIYIAYSEKIKQRINRLFSRLMALLTGRFKQDNSLYNGDDSCAGGADSHTKAVMLIVFVHCLLILLIYVFIYNSKTHYFRCKIYFSYVVGRV